MQTLLADLPDGVVASPYMITGICKFNVNTDLRQAAMSCLRAELLESDSKVPQDWPFLALST